MCGMTPTWAIWCSVHVGQGSSVHAQELKLGWNSGGVTQEDKKNRNISETVQDRTTVTTTD